MTRALSIGLVCVLSGCGPGALRITSWGEEFIEQGIPASLFADGFDVAYSKFEVSFSDVTVRSTRTGAALAQTEPMRVDLHLEGPHEVTRLEGAPNTFDDVSYVIGGPLRIEGTLGLGAQRKRFAWSFAVDTAYTQCVQPELGPSVVLSSGRDETVELTVHGDHLFYDDLFSPEARLRGTAVFLADTDGDDEVTEAELRAVELTTLPRAQYGTGSLGDVFTLWDFLSLQVRTVGHFRGEGDCLARPR